MEEPQEQLIKLEEEYRERLEDILSEGEDTYNRLQGLEETIKEKKEESSQLETEIKQMVHTAIDAMSRRSRVSFGKSLTLRDGKVHVFGRGYTASLKRIKRNKATIARNGYFEGGESFKDMMEEVEKIAFKSPGDSVKLNSKVRLFEGYEKVKWDRICIRIVGRNYGDSTTIKMRGEDYQDRSSKEKKLILAFADEIEHVYNEMLDAYEARVKNRTRVKSAIQQITSKHLVSASI